MRSLLSIHYLRYAHWASIVIVDMASAFEWLLVLGMLFVTWTFSSELQATRPYSNPDTAS